MLPNWAYWTLLMLFNVLWIVTYVLVIRRGRIDRVPGVPLFALTLNLAWDFSGAFLIQSPMAQKYINILFLGANLWIASQWVRYWRNDFRKLSAAGFYFYWTLAFVVSFVIMLRGSVEIGDVLLFKTGFLDNFINSALFIVMFYRRPGLEGQSIYIGIAKMLGTGAVSLTGVFNPYPGTETSLILPWLYIGIFVLDLAYVVEYHRKARQLGIDPWRRW